MANTDVDGHRNYWSDECLAKAAGSTARAGSTALDFYQVRLVWGDAAKWHFIREYS